MRFAKREVVRTTVLRHTLAEEEWRKAVRTKTTEGKVAKLTVGKSEENRKDTSAEERKRR